MPLFLFLRNDEMQLMNVWRRYVLDRLLNHNWYDRITRFVGRDDLKSLQYCYLLLYWLLTDWLQTNERFYVIFISNSISRYFYSLQFHLHLPVKPISIDLITHPFQFAHIVPSKLNHHPLRKVNLFRWKFQLGPRSMAKNLTEVWYKHNFFPDNCLWRKREIPHDRNGCWRNRHICCCFVWPKDEQRIPLCLA